jgi:hypothetical protein
MAAEQNHQSLPWASFPSQSTGIRLVALAHRDLKTLVSVGTTVDARLSVDAASALAGVLTMSTAG